MNLPQILRALAMSTCLVTATTSAALACGHGVEHDLDDYERPVALKPSMQRPTVIQAEQSFQRANFTDAIRLATGAYPELRAHAKDLSKTQDLQLARGGKLVAISTVRLKGQLDLKTVKVTTKKATIQKNLAWAASTLEQLHAQSPDDPELQGYLAEALALDAKTQDRALQLLTDLYSRDLLTDAYGFAALARHTSHEPTAQDAQRRCMTMSNQNSALCQPKAQANTQPKAQPASKKAAKAVVSSL